MKKRIEEIEEMATKGSMGVFLGEDQMCIAGKNSELNTEVVCLCIVTTLENIEDHDAPNAILLAHRWNTHRELLEALKRAETWHNGNAWRNDNNKTKRDAWQETSDRFRRAIENASFVEVDE